MDGVDYFSSRMAEHAVHAGRAQRLCESIGASEGSDQPHSPSLERFVFRARPGAPTSHLGFTEPGWNMTVVYRRDSFRPMIGWMLRSGDFPLAAGSRPKASAMERMWQATTPQQAPMYPIPMSRAWRA